MDEAYEPPTTETRTVYGLQLQVGFCQVFPTLFSTTLLSRITAV